MYGNQAGGRTQTSQFRRQDLNAALQLSLKDVYTTQKQTLTVNNKKIRLTIPAGVENSQVIKISGHGAPGTNGVANGDLFITFSRTDVDGFKREGNNLYGGADVALYVAVLGGELLANTFNGKVKLKIPEETTTGTKVKLKGKGFPTYKKEGEFGNAEIKEIIIRDLVFNPNLAFGYQKISVLEPDLVEAQKKIKWADHLVWIHPVWWGGLPAITKGFIDRVFLPGFGFKYRENSVWWDKLLKGKTAHIITILDTPRFYYWFAFGKPSVNQLKKSTLEFCGIQPVKVTYIGPIKNSNETDRKKWLEKIDRFGNKNM